MGGKLLKIAVDTIVATALLLGGFAVHSLSGAPNWLLPAFAVPFLLYLHFRLDPIRFNYRGITLLVVFLTLALLLIQHLAPGELREHAHILLPILAFVLRPLFRRRPKREP